MTRLRLLLWTAIATLVYLAVLGAMVRAVTG